MPLLQTANLTVEESPSGIFSLLFHVEGRNQNVLGRRVFDDLDKALAVLSGNPALKLLVVRSGKKAGFCAGADVHEFGAVTGAAEAEAISARGQELFGKLAGLPVPTLAVLHGPCLGGGLELALACDYRLAADVPGTQLGFPEIELGLIPGWGGTQRLPRVVGLERSLQMILGARRADARQALAWGLADAVSSGLQGDPSFDALVVRALREGKRPRPGLPLRTWRQRLVESTGAGRALIYRGTTRVLRRRVPDDMPAPAAALEAVRVGVSRGPEAGLAAEREAVGRLATSTACRNLVGLFLARERARKAFTPEAAAGPVRRVGVVGAGTMGAGIAQLAALRGFEVVVQEVNAEALGAGTLKIAALFEKALERRLITQEDFRRKLAAVRGTTTWEGFGDLDLVVEAAVEDPEVKQSLFRELGQRTRPTTLLATNTSSLSVERLAAGLEHPERIAGLHFFNPVHKMPLVEVARAPRTSEAAASGLARWAAALGKTPVVVKDSPGFVVNRVLTPYLNEAVLLAGEGLGIDQVDQVMVRFGMPMGPLELLDQVGLDVAAHIADALMPSFGDRFSPNPVFARMRERGWLGQKSGTGFYAYGKKRKRVNREAAAVLRAAASGAAARHPTPLPTAARLAEARERMVLLMCNEAAACLGEGLAEGAEMIDLALVLGTGWAPHRGGPLRYAADRGYPQVLDGLEALARRHGPRFGPCAALRRLAGQ